MIFSVRIVRSLGSSYVLALWDSIEVDFNLCHGQDVGGRSHGDEEVLTGRSASIGSLNHVRLSSESGNLS